MFTIEHFLIVVGAAIVALLLLAALTSPALAPRLRR